MKKKITKLIAGTLAITSVLFLNPTNANAEWKQDNKGWWYTEGNSWATGWRYIGGNWYYFDVGNGYMITSRWVDGGYYVDANGVWVKTSKYNMNQVMENHIAIGEKNNMKYTLGGDYMSYIGEYVDDEPCLFVFSDYEREAFIGLNTLNVYDANTKKIIDTIKIIK